MPSLPSIVGIPETTEESIHSSWDTLTTVIHRLAHKGIVVDGTPPSFDFPEVTTTLVDTNNQEYLVSNARCLAWLNYISPQISINEGLLLQVRNEKTAIEATHRAAIKKQEETLAKKDKRTKEEVEDMITLDPRYVELVQFEQELTQEKLLLDDKKENLSRTLRVISRHIEVKKLDAEMNSTAVSMAQHRPFRPGGGLHRSDR